MSLPQNLLPQVPVTSLSTVTSLPQVPVSLPQAPVSGAQAALPTIQMEMANIGIGKVENLTNCRHF